MKRVALIAGIALLIAGAVPFSGAAVLWGKAALGNALLGIAWEKNRTTGIRAKPWPGADVTPVAMLEFPRLGKKTVVLDSAGGAALAWGVGHVAGTAQPGKPGLAAFGGHKDSHFAFLEHLEPGDEVFLNSSDGNRQRFRITSSYVVDSRFWRFPILREGTPKLALSTCWPFGSKSEHKRFILFAELAGKNSPQGEGVPISSTQPQPGGRAEGPGSPARSLLLPSPQERPETPEI